jgi:transposase
MTPKHKSDDYKKSAVEYYLVGDKSQLEVCEIFKCSARSLMRWVDKYEKEGEIKRQNRKPVVYKVRKEHVKFLLDEKIINDLCSDEFKQYVNYFSIRIDSFDSHSNGFNNFISLL